MAAMKGSVRPDASAEIAGTYFVDMDGRVSQCIMKDRSAQGATPDIYYEWISVGKESDRGMVAKLRDLIVLDVADE
jgi:hypothetical protein